MRMDDVDKLDDYDGADVDQHDDYCFVSHLSKLTETLRRSCSPTPPHWAGLTSPDRWKPGKNLIMIAS